MRALVTGGAQRLGRALALALAEDGYDVAVHCHGSAEAAQEVAARIGAMGRRAAVVQADLLDDAQTLSLVDRAAAALDGPLTVLVNNASIFEPDSLETATLETWDSHIGSNLKAPFLLTQAFAAQAPAVLTDETGEALASAAVVNMIDMRVLKPTPEFITYALAKAGLWWFTRTAAQALAPRVRVNGIGPGPTLASKRQDDEHFRAQRQAALLQRGANQSDIVAALRYLLAAPAVTGQLMLVDGGTHLNWQSAEYNGPE